MAAEDIYGTVRRERIIAIVRGVAREEIVDVAAAVLEGGIKMLEVTCNTVGAAEMVRLLSKEMGERMVIGAGTVIDTQLCEEMIQAGARYIIAPDVNPDVVRYCVERDVAVMPGTATATEVLTARRQGARMVKIFPAAQIGVEYIRALRGPIDDVEFVAVGGVRPNNIADFIQAGCVAVAVGGSVIRKELVERSDYEVISETAREYVKVLGKV